MIWKDYSNLKNSHAFLSPSKYQWLNYDDEKLLESFRNHKRAALGTKLHAWAATAISLARRQPENAEAINAFINDGIGFGMEPEVLLYYSPRCYGTADAVSFNKNVLRIHDLKTGAHKVHPAGRNQLLLYAALFCLDYKVDPLDIDETVLRIYQGVEVMEFCPEPQRLLEVTRRVIEADRLLEEVEGSVVL